MESAKPVTVVGAGPVGSLLAIYLARRGHTVKVLERRFDMRRAQSGAGRSINLAISTRGLRALHEVGLAHAVLERAIPMRGRMIHAVSGALSFQPYGKDDSEYINSMSRAELNQALMTAAEATERVQLQFNARVLARDFQTHALQWQDEVTGTRHTETVPVLIGTDGSSSVIRAAMEKLPGHTGSQVPLSYNYKELSIPPISGGGFALEKNALHIWPRGAFMLIALPNFDGSFTCTLFLAQTGSPSFADLTTSAAVSEFFATHFADVKALIPNLEEGFFANPEGRMVTVKCAPWHVGGHTLLLGDAAHSIVPFFGQGLNCGFEDCAVLNEGMQTLGENWQDLFEKFSALRKPHTDAIADMAVENFAEMRDKVGQAQFLLQKEVEKRLQKAFPGEFLSRYAMVTFSNTPYRAAFDAGVIADAIVRELCDNLPSADHVDLRRAAELIRARFTPFLQAQEKGSNAWI